MFPLTHTQDIKHEAEIYATINNNANNNDYINNGRKLAKVQDMKNMGKNPQQKCGGSLFGGRRDFASKIKGLMKTLVTVNKQQFNNKAYSRGTRYRSGGGPLGVPGRITLARVYFIYNCQSKRVHTSTSFTIKNDVFTCASTAYNKPENNLQTSKAPVGRTLGRRGWRIEHDPAEYCASSVRRTNNVSDEKFGTTVFPVRTHMLACVYICYIYLTHVYPRKYILYKIEVVFREAVGGSDIPYARACARLCVCVYSKRYIHG